MESLNALDHVKLLKDVDEVRWERVKRKHPEQEEDKAFSVPIDEVLKVMVPRIKTALAKKQRVPFELIDKENSVIDDPTSAAKMYFGEATKLKAGALDDALLPKDKVAADRHEARAFAIELCRKWFQRAVAVEKGLGLFFAITKAKTEGIGKL